MRKIETRIEQLERMPQEVDRSEFAAYVRRFIPNWRGTPKQAFLKYLELNKPDHENTNQQD